MSLRSILALGFTVALAACSNAAPRASAPEQPAPRLVVGTTAVEHAYVPTIDPASMKDSEIARVVPTSRRCAFRYTEDSDPVLATDGSRGVVKINGALVTLAPARAGDPAPGGVLTADGIRLTVQPLSNGTESEADLRFEVAGGPGLRVDYRGFYSCSTT